MALRNRYVAGESDIGPQKQICGWRVSYIASETDMWLESQIWCHTNRYVAGEKDIWLQRHICGWRVRYMASERDMWLKSQI